MSDDDKTVLTTLLNANLIDMMKFRNSRKLLSYRISFAMLGSFLLEVFSFSLSRKRPIRFRNSEKLKAAKSILINSTIVREKVQVGEISWLGLRIGCEVKRKAK